MIYSLNNFVLTFKELYNGIFIEKTKEKEKIFKEKESSTKGTLRHYKRRYG